MSEEKVPPQALIAERATIGSMLIEQQAVHRARLHLEAGDFYSENNRTIFKIICEIMDEDAGLVPDPVVVAERLREGKNVGEGVGTKYLSECVEEVSSASHVEHYAKIVRHTSLDRQVNKQLHITSRDKTPENVSKLGDLIFAFRGVRGSPVINFETDIEAIVEEILSKKEEVIDTGFFELDCMLGGMQEGDLMTIGSRTGGGKTAFMVRMACNAAMEGWSVLYATTEMSAKQIVMQILPMASKIPAHKFRSNKLNEDEKMLVNDLAVNELKKLPIKVLDRSRLSIQDIQNVVTSHQPHIIFVDYLQRCYLPKAESRNYQIEEFMVQLKSFSQDVGLRTVLGVQLDRGMDKNPNRPPELSDLRGSGAIEHESVQVGLLWEPPEAVLKKRFDHVPPQDGNVAMEFRIAKNRFGAAKVAVDLEINKEMIEILERKLTKEPTEPEEKKEESFV